MGDELEKYVIRNREDFDTDLPKEDVWRGIQNSLQRTTSPLDQFWKIAAILFLMSTLYLVIDRSLQTSSPEEMVSTETKEFGQVERYYSQLISERKREISRFDKSDLKRSFLVEIERLDQMYDQLKGTYAEQNSTDQVMDAMINNLKLRIDILNQQLEILKKLNQTQNEKDQLKSI